MIAINSTFMRFREKSGMAVIDFGWLVIFNLLLFQGAIQEWLPAAAYIDEGFSLLSLMLYFLFRKNFVGYAIEAEEKKLIAAMLLLMFVGFAGNLMYGIVRNVFAVFVDALSCIKFLIIFITILRLTRNRSNLYLYFETEVKLLCVPLAICMLLNLVMNIDMGSDIRFGMRSFRFIFVHPYLLASFLIDCIAILSINKRKNKFFIKLLLCVIASTLRSKAIGFIPVYLGVNYLVTNHIKINAKKIVFLGCIAAVLTWNQIWYYFSHDTILRAAFYIKGVQIANDFFPLGTGFATYASVMANTLYSPLYYQYGLSKVYGLKIGSTSFGSDTFWPIIIGQFGWVGICLFLLALFYLFRIITKKALFDNALLAVLSIFIYQLITTASDSAFFHPLAVGHFFSLAVVLNSAKYDLPAISYKMAQMSGVCQQKASQSSIFQTPDLCDHTSEILRKLKTQ